MADKLLRTRNEEDRPSLRVNPQIPFEERYNITSGDESQFAKGLRTGAQGMSAGSFANQALMEEFRGDPNWQESYRRAIDTQAAGDKYTPRVGSLRDIRSVNDALDFAGGATGQGLISMAPTLASALLFRGKGALGTAYGLERNEAALRQYNEPNQQGADVKDRLIAANAVGIANAGLEAAAPRSIVQGAIRRQGQGSFLRNVGREALTEAGTEAAQTLISDKGAQYIDPTVRTDPWEVADAAAAGFLTGGAASSATRAAGRAARAGIERATDTAKEYRKLSKASPAVVETPTPSDYLSITAKRMSEASDVAGNPTEFAKRVFGNIADNSAEAILNGDNSVTPGATVDETLQRIQEWDTRKAQTTQEFANSLLSTTNTPAEIRQTIEAMNGDFANPANQEFIAQAVRGENTRQRVNENVNELIEAAPKRITRDNLQDTTTSEQASFNKLMFDNMTDEAKNNLSVREKLPEIVNSLLAFAARTKDLTRNDVESIAKVRDAMDLFANPDQAIDSLVEYANLPRDQTSFLSRIKEISNAQEDIRNPNSFLYASLTEDAKDTLGANELKGIARLVDQFALSDSRAQVGDSIINGMSSVFGTTENARRVLDYYQQLNRQDLQYEPSTTQFTERSEPESSFKYADAKSMRPFSRFNGTTMNETGFRARMRESALAAIDMRKQGVDARPISMSEFVRRTDKNPASELNKIRKDLQNRIDQHESRKDEDRSKQIRNLKGELSAINELERRQGPEAALRMYDVVEVRNREQNDLVATDETISNMGNFADAKGARDTRVTFQKNDGKKLTLSAEAMWRTQGNLEGSGRGEQGRRRASRLFKEAVASVLARDDISGVITPLEDVVVDRKMNLRAVTQQDPVYRKQVQNTLRAAEDNLSTLQETLDSVVDEYMEATDHFDRAMTPEELTSEAAEEGVTRRNEIDSIMDANIERQQQRIKELKRRSPAGIIAREKLKMYQEAKRQIDAINLNEAIDYRDMNREGMPGADQTGPLGTNQLTRSRLNEELSDTGARLFEEDTGQAIGTERRKITPPAKKKDLLTQMAEEMGREQVRKDIVQRESSQTNAPLGRKLNAAERKQALDEIRRIRGKDVQVVFKNMLGEGSGRFYMDPDKTNRVIQIAIDSSTPLSIAWHESMHDFIAMLGATPEERNIRNQLFNAASTPSVMKQLRALLADHPKALQQIQTSREERASYMYQFWAEGALKVGSKHNTVLGRISKFFLDALGVVSSNDKTLELLDSLHSGKFSDPSTVANVMANLHVETLRDRTAAVVDPFTRGIDNVFTGATDRLRKTNITALEELADLFHREPDRERGGLPFLQRRSQEVGKFLNGIQTILQDTNRQQRLDALNNLENMKKPNGTVEQGIKSYLDSLYNYMKEAGVQRFDQKTKKWVPMNRVKNYFPRVWDKNFIRNNEGEFHDLLSEFVGPRQASDTIAAILNGDGTLELKQNEHSLGFTPFAQAVENRELTFINEGNAERFSPFQSKDLVDILTTYTQQAVHRAEFTRAFGNNGEVIKNKLEEAKNQGATPRELALASNAVMALEGTLGHDFNPRLKSLMSGIITYQNVILLPLSLFASLVDPLGIGVRSNSFRESAKAFAYGMKGIKDALLRNEGKDGLQDMAKLLGIIDNQNMLEAMGYVYNSMHMSRTMRTINNKFFRFNGMELWNQRMRVSALGAAQRFVARNINNKRYMDELGITKADVFENSDGTLALTRDDIAAKLKKQGVKDADQQAAAIEKRIQQAMFKFVDGAVLRPNAAHRPIWGSDPRYQLIFHLKQFTYSFHNTILKRVMSESANQNNSAAYNLLLYVPFMLASDIARGSLTGTLNTSASVYETLTRAVARSTVLGVNTFGVEALEDAQRGGVPGSDFLGPTMDHLVSLIETIFGNSDPKKLVTRSIPGGSTLRGVI